MIYMNFKLIKFSLLLIFISVLFLLPSGVNAQTAPTYTFILGGEEYASGPMKYSYDAQLVVEFYDGKFHGYYGGGAAPGAPAVTQHYISTNFDDLFHERNRQQTYYLTLSSGFPNEVCGTWLNNLIRLSPSKVAAVYHSEKNCVNATTEKTMSYATSDNNGVTWNKRGPILSVYDGERSQCADCDDAGDATVVKRNGYYYMFSTETTKDGWKQGIARAVVQADGLPGQWFKYYNGGYTEPALGGKFTPIGNGQLPGTRVAYNKIFKNFMSVGTTGKWGFILHTTLKNEPTKSNPYIYFFPQVSTNDDPNVDDWVYYKENPNRLEFYAYSVIVDPDNLNGDVDNDFFVYYTKINTGQDFNSMYMMRRRIKLYPNTLAKNVSYYPLAKYTLPSKTRTSISNPVYQGATSNTYLGYLSYSSQATANQTMLYECYVSASDDYKLQITPCSNSKHIRKLGYIEKTQTDKATITLKECYSAANSKHYYVGNEACTAGDTNTSTLGYLYPRNNVTDLDACPLSAIGDANCDSAINTLDYVCWLQEYNTQTKLTGCNSSDFDRERGVSILDYSTWFSSYSP